MICRVSDTSSDVTGVKRLTVSGDHVDIVPAYGGAQACRYDSHHPTHEEDQSAGARYNDQVGQVGSVALISRGVMILGMSTAITGNEGQAGDRALELERALRRAERAESVAEQLHNDNELRANRDKYKYQLLNRIVGGARVASWIAVTALPLIALRPIAESFAGQDTRLEASLSISLAYSVSVTILLGLSIAQSRLRKKKVKRQRERLDKLEASLLEVQHTGAAKEGVA